jgi:hypothetical protein
MARTTSREKAVSVTYLSAWHAVVIRKPRYHAVQVSPRPVRFSYRHV